MKVNTQNKKPTFAKGQAKPKPDVNDPEKNPLLFVENKTNFSISTSNLLQDPTELVIKDCEDFDPKSEKVAFDTKRIRESSKIIIILRYYEYLCTAEFTFGYIIPLLESGLTGKDVFMMVCHCLKNKLLCNVPSFDTVFEPDIIYTGKINY